MKIKKHNIRLIITIVIIVSTVLSGTYAYLQVVDSKNTTSTVAGCFDVNYQGEVVSNSLVSTTNYIEGHHTQIILSRNENCKIYTEATIYIHTNPETTAPINGEQKALKYKIKKNGEEIDSNNDETKIDGVITTTEGDEALITVPLTDTATTYDIYIWIDQDISQGLYNGLSYTGYIYATSHQTSTVKPINAFAAEKMVPNAQSDSSINFSQTSEASNTNGVYIRSGTENNNYPIYYYRGNVNNNLIFADTCWKVVRTTETGGLKLIYNGVPSNNQCNNTGSATVIGNNSFNENSNSPAYVGYMYGKPYPSNYKEISSNTQYVYGNGVTYSNGTYTLTNTKTATWSSVYESGLTNHHYTCFTTGTTCSSVYYIYNTTSTEAYYLTLTGVNNIETALSQMLDNNTYSSTIKGNNTTEGTLDYWYYTNIEQKGYSSYIEDTIWCNDRSIHSLGGFNPNGGLTSIEVNELNKALLHPIYEKYISDTPIPSLSCSRNIDRFTVSSSNGNGALDYPVGLLTLDEILLAGADNQFSSNNSYYLYSNYSYWASSPVRFVNLNANGAIGSGVNYVGGLGSADININIGVRPSVSLKPGFSLTGTGNGTATNPYKVG